MANLTSVGISSGVPNSGTGTVSTIDNLIAVGSPINNGSSSVQVAISGASSTVTSSMSALVVALSPNGGAITSLSSAAVYITNGSNIVAVTGSASAPTSSMSALVVSVSPNSQNPNGQTTMANSAPVTIASNQSAVSVILASSGFGGTTSSLSTPVVPADQYASYIAVGAGATQTSLGTSLGRAGDYLAYVTVFPANSGCGVVTIFDSTGTTFGSFAGGGTTALPSLVPFMIPVGAFSVSSGWKITTGSSVTAVGIGKFT